MSAELASDLVAFRHYLKAERGMAANTVLAYGRDLDRFAVWVTAGGLADFLKPSVRELSNYLCRLHEEGLAPASIARPCTPAPARPIASAAAIPLRPPIA